MYWSALPRQRNHDSWVSLQGLNTCLVPCHLPSRTGMPQPCGRGSVTAPPLRRDLRRRHPSRATAARMPHYEGHPTTQEWGRGRGATGRGAGVRAFNWARHPNVTSCATPARGNEGTGWCRASDGDARAAKEAEHGGLGHIRRCPCCCPCSSGHTTLPQKARIRKPIWHVRLVGLSISATMIARTYADRHFGPHSTRSAPLYFKKLGGRSH